MKRVGFFWLLIPVQSKRVKCTGHVLYSPLTCDCALASTAVNYFHIKSLRVKLY